jgi:UDP:flavonoid glycosyltransferase YjiC (YdhE family)
VATILIGWEMGGGLGHISNLAPLAKEFTDRGHRVAAALKNGIGLERMEPNCFKTFHIEAPIGKRTSGTHTLADVLYAHGFADASRLQERIRVWRDIIEHVGPDLIVSDYSPWLNAVVRGSIPAAAYGNCFSIPSEGSCAPQFRAWMDGFTPEKTIARENEIISVLRRIAPRAGISPPSNIPELLRGDRCFPYGLPEFDPYQASRTDRVRLTGRPEGHKTLPMRDLFLYLKTEHPALGFILQTVRSMGLTAAAYIPDMAPEVRRGFAGGGLEILDKPLPTGIIIRSFRAVADHGGWLGQHAYAAGIPLLVFPKQLEQYVAARPAAEQGRVFLIGMDAATNPDILEKAFRALLSSQTKACSIRQADEISRRENYIDHDTLALEILNTNMK